VSWNLACPDWAERLKSGRSLVPDLPLNAKEGNRAVAVFNKLRLADVPGTPTMGEAGGDWFRDIVRALFGALDPLTRARMIRELFLLVPKKNNKTTGGALLMLTALLLNMRPRASFIMTAPVQDTAEKAFEAALTAEQARLQGETLWYRMIAGGAAPRYVRLRPRPNLAALLAVALCSSVLAYLFWNRGVEEVGANVAGLFVHLMPVFGVVLAWLFLNEELAPYHVMGIVLILSGIWLTSRYGRRRPDVDEAAAVGTD